MLPDRLVLGVAAEGDGFHVVGGNDPRNAGELAKAGDQAAQQGFLAHVGVKLDKHPAAIFEAGGKEVARLADEVRVGEGKLTDLAPINLEQFAGQALEADGDSGGQRGAGAAQGSHIVVEGGDTAEIGMVGVSACEFEHALDTEFLLEPDANLLREDRNRTLTLARCRLLVERLAQYA